MSLDRLCLGTWSLGGSHFGPYDCSDSQRTLKHAYELGIRYIDTALFYARGRSLDYIQQAIGSFRDQLYISSKGGLFWNGKAVCHDASPNALTKDCESTLKRLKTDYLDLYSLHWPDSSVPLESSIESLITLKERGLIKEWGACNLNDNQVQTVQNNFSLPSLQSPYNWLRRKDNDKLDASLKGQFKWWVYSPLEQGCLATPDFRSHQSLSTKDFRRKNNYYLDLNSFELELFNSLVKESGLTHTQYALQWLLEQESISKIIWGPRTVSQLKDGMILFS